MGGKFKNGFLSAAAEAAIGHLGISKALKLGEPSTGGPAKVAARTVLAGVTGGIVSEVSGGSFANGAYTGAFQHLFNEEACRTLNRRAKAAEARRKHHQRRIAAEKAAHFARNAENDAWLKANGLYGRDDIMLSELNKVGRFGMKQASAAENKYHLIGTGNENNIKFTSRVSRNENWWQSNVSNRYGRYEIILKPNGNSTYTHVNDPVNMGTLNYGNNPITHVTSDVIPYKKYGNVPN